MLAQSFQSAADLNISEAQKDALIKTLVLLETGKLTHARFPEHYEDAGGSFTGHFNMDGWYAYAEDCGTICCIGGTAELVGKVSFDCWPEIKELSELFAPVYLMKCWSSITPDQAARALRSYLTTGRANWPAGMGEA